MAIVYLGNVAEVKQELERFKPVLDAKYREIFGDVLAAKLRNASARLLCRESFFDNVVDLNVKFGGNFSSEEPNKMFVLTPSEIKPDLEGRIRKAKVRTAPVFYISKDGFNHSHSQTFTENPVASYVHEYDHFVWYVLHKVPMYVLNLALQNGLGAKGTESNDELSREVTERADIDIGEATTRHLLLLYRKLFTFVYERATRILDKLVLSSIGIEVPLEWRGKEKEYNLFPLPVGAAVFPVDGDPFLGMNDEEAIRRFLSWENTCVPAVPYAYIVNFINSIKEMNVSRVSINDILKKT